MRLGAVARACGASWRLGGGRVLLLLGLRGGGCSRGLWLLLFGRRGVCGRGVARSYGGGGGLGCGWLFWFWGSGVGVGV